MPQSTEAGAPAAETELTVSADAEATATAAAMPEIATDLPEPEQADPDEPADDAAGLADEPAWPAVSPLRLAEALIFAAAEPIAESDLAARLTAATGPVDITAILAQLQQDYAGRGITLVAINDRWAFRTAADLAAAMRVEAEVQKKLSRAAVETLAIIAYHQPVTRAEIEGIRGVATSKGTLDLLMETGWIRPGRRRETPGRPLTWITTDHFLDHFGLSSLRDLPGVDDLRATGLLDARPVLGPLTTNDTSALPSPAGAEDEE